MMVGRLLSYWEGNFSGDMLNFRRVYKMIQKPFPIGSMHGIFTCNYYLKNGQMWVFKYI